MKNKARAGAAGHPWAPSARAKRRKHPKGQPLQLQHPLPLVLPLRFQWEYLNKPKSFSQQVLSQVLEAQPFDVGKLGVLALCPLPYL